MQSNCYFFQSLGDIQRVVAAFLQGTSRRQESLLLDATALGSGCEADEISQDSPSICKQRNIFRVLKRREAPGEDPKPQLDDPQLPPSLSAAASEGGNPNNIFWPVFC